MAIASAIAAHLRLFEAPRPAQTEDQDKEASGARAAFNRAQRWLLLAAFALLLVLRLPLAWEHGRFQDEEATVFLAYAWHHPWLDALFRPFGGYLNIGANATTLLAARLVQGGIVPLEQAPYLTMIMALAAQMLPAILILTGAAQWLSRRLAVVAALLIIAITPATEEVFYNVMHIQFHLALCVALILALDVPRSRVASIGYGVLLFVAPLCGPGAILLLPLFALRALVDRDPKRLMQLTILAAGTAVQLLLFYSSSPMRGSVFDPATVASAMFVRLIALPLFGIKIANIAGHAIYTSQDAGGTFWWWFIAPVALLFTALVVESMRRRDAAIWLVLSGLLIAAASLCLGGVLDRAHLLAARGAERYNFLPIVLLGLALIVLAMRQNYRGRHLYAGILTLMLVSAAYYYPKPLPQFAEGPSWPAEVRAWRSDHSHPLAVWPRPWTADLSDERRPCSPPRRDLAAITDPRYCESGWIAGFFRPDFDGRPRGEPTKAVERAKNTSDQ